MPENVAMPFAAFWVAVPLRVPLPGFVPMAIVTDAVLVVTTLPPASCTCTVTAGVIEEPAAVFDGCVPKASFVAVPTVILNELLVAPVNPVLLAASVYPLPALSIERLLKVAVPLTAATVVVPLSVPLLGFVPMASVTLAVLVVRLPN